MTPEDCARSRCPRECLRTSPDQLRVHLGVSDRTEAGAEAVSVAVRRIILHPGWDKVQPLNNITQGHDLALLELDTPVKFRFHSTKVLLSYTSSVSDTVWPICLPTKGDAPLLTTDMEVQVFGFGVREIRGADRSYAEILNETPLNISDHEYCRSLVSSIFKSL